MKKSILGFMFLIIAGFLTTASYAAKPSTDIILANDIFSIVNKDDMNNCFLKEPAAIKDLMKKMGAVKTEIVWDFEDVDGTDDDGNENIVTIPMKREVYLTPEFELTLYYYEDPEDSDNDLEGLSLEFRTFEGMQQFLESAGKMGFYKDEDVTSDYLYGWGNGVGYYILNPTGTLLTFMLNVG